MLRLRTPAALLGIARSNVRSCVVTPKITREMRGDPDAAKKEAEEKEKKVNRVKFPKHTKFTTEDVRRDGAVVHKLTQKPQVYELERVMKALRACVEPAFADEPVSGRFYCQRPTPEGKSKKKVDVKGSLVFPNSFGSRARVGLLAEEGNPLVKELEGKVEQIITADNFISFFKDVHNEMETLADVYVATPKVEIQLRRFGAILKEKTPTSGKGLIAGSIEEIDEVVQRACYTKRYVIPEDGIVEVQVANLDFLDEMVQENIKHAAVAFRQGCAHTDGQFLDYVVLFHGYAGFCVDIPSLGILF